MVIPYLDDILVMAFCFSVFSSRLITFLSRVFTTTSSRAYSFPVFHSPDSIVTGAYNPTQTYKATVITYLIHQVTCNLSVLPESARSLF